MLRFFNTCYNKEHVKKIKLCESVALQAQVVVVFNDIFRPKNNDFRPKVTNITSSREGLQNTRNDSCMSTAV